MKNIIYYLTFCFGLVCTSNAYGQTIDKNNLEAKIDSLIPISVNDSTPGLVVGIVQNGELVYSKGYGLANLSYGIQNDPKMVYNIGSVSKQFLGYSFAILHVKGDLNIDDPVNKYLEDWPEFEYTVTLRHLLTHTSGYREAYTMSNLAGRIIGIDRLSQEECLEVVRKQPQLEFTPGSRWTYNSTAWVILAEVLKNVTGQSADEWVENNILQPLKMQNTQIESFVGEVILNTAESYTHDKEHGYINQESNRAIFGAAEVYTNIPDLVKWINNYRTAEIGGKVVNDLFLDPFILNDKTNSEYALGIRNSSYQGLKHYSHTGGHEAFSTQLSYFPDHDLGIITISNFGGKGWLSTTKIADLLLEEYMTTQTNIENHQIEINKEYLEQYTGLYLASTLNRTLDLTMSEDSLSIGGRTKLIPVSQNAFKIDGWDGQIQIDNLSNGKTQLTIINGTKETYNKVEKWTPNLEDLKSFKGDYWSDEIETVYHLKMTDEKLTIQHRWLGEIILEPVTNDFFKTDWGYNVNFVRNKAGEISGLSIYSGRTLNVFFHRKE
jgi:CubicO group peptidase (beta-lactamase class C family)